MYEPFFGFASRPFPATPSVERYYPASSIEAARASLARCVERAEGIGIAVGGSGIGKTLLCDVIARQFTSKYQIARLLCGRLSGRKALLQSLLFELGSPYRKLDEGELRLALIEYVAKLPAGSRGVLLIVDEAHTLNWRLFDELRLLTNLTREGRPQFSLLLAGGPALDERLTHPRLEAFSQRIAARCYLGHLQRDETAGYIRAQLGASGMHSGSAFSETAVDAVYRLSEGIPRLINQICDHALLLASLGGHRRIEAPAIEEAWADLQQLPTAVGVKRSAGREKTVVEFGALDDGVDDNRRAIPFPALAGDSTDGDTAAAAEQTMSQLADHLADLDEEFTPAGSIGPEVELVFDGWLPQHESFAEEEVLLDRYVRVDDRDFSAHPMVASREGRELAALLDAAPQYRSMATSPPRRHAAVGRMAMADELVVTDDAGAELDFGFAEPDPELGEAMILVSPGIPRATTLVPMAESQPPFGDSFEHRPTMEFGASPAAVTTSLCGVLPAEAVAVSNYIASPRVARANPADDERAFAPTRAAERARQIDTVWPDDAPMVDETRVAAPSGPALATIGAQEPAPAVAASAKPTRELDVVRADDSSESDVVVVDDEPNEIVSVPTRPAPLVRRQEYRQLFAKLRRG